MDAWWWNGNSSAKPQFASRILSLRSILDERSSAKQADRLVNIGLNNAREVLDVVERLDEHGDSESASLARILGQLENLYPQPEPDTKQTKLEIASHVLRVQAELIVMLLKRERCCRGRGE